MRSFLALDPSKEWTEDTFVSEVSQIGLSAVIAKLLAYCRANQWAGYDPYDALNSPIFAALPFLDRRLPRLFLTQAVKRSPVNFRRLLHIPKTQNAKAIALFLSAIIATERTDPTFAGNDFEEMIALLRVLRSPQTPYWCWGYSFPWQSRSILVPAGAPNLVCTCFAAEALLDAFEHGHEPTLLEMAVSSADYLLNELFWSEPHGAKGFSYPMPASRECIHNAHFLAAAVLCRVYRHTGDQRYVAPALDVTRYSVAKQHQDGSWYYGENPAYQWIDNFHTGYNLCALHSIGQDSGSQEFTASMRAGYAFYRSHFFRDDGAPRYFHRRTYPIDIHCVAQSIITLLKCNELYPDNHDLVVAIYRWAMRHMWDPTGFFYYRALRTCTLRGSYMRWSQAWMLLALARMREASLRANPDYQDD